MKCKILFSGKNKKNPYFVPAEFAHIVVKVNNYQEYDKNIHFFPLISNHKTKQI